MADKQAGQVPSRAEYAGGPIGPGQFRLVTLAPKYQMLQTRRNKEANVEYPWYTQEQEEGQEKQPRWSGSRQRTVRFRIDVFDFASAPPYEALSYTWDDYQRTTLMMTPKPLMATGNLALALQQLQLPDKPRLLWVDALCINQDDTDEMSRQIKMMRDIYSHAHRTIMWLGPADADTGLAFRAFARRAREWDDNTLRPPAAISSSRYTPEEATAALKLMQNRYFTRVWIIQEIVVSRAVAVVCGRFSMPLDTLFSGAYWYAFSLPKFSSDGRVTGTMGQTMIFDGLNPWRRAFHAHTVGDESLRLEHALVTTRNCSATDAKDRVFSLLGFTNNVSAETFPIDYSASVADVYSRATKAIVRSGYVDILSSVQRLPDSSTDLPSWVPDWRVPWDNVPLAARKWFYNASGRARWKTPRRGQHDASAAAAAAANDGGGELHRLKMEGYLVDVVAQAFDPWEELKHKDVHDFWFDECQMQEITRKYGLWGYYPLTREPIEQAYLRTLVADLLPGFRRWERRPTLDWRRLVRWAFPSKGHAYSCGHGRSGSGGDVRNLFSASMPLEVRAELMHNIKDFSRHRRLFITSGGFLGLGPAMTQRKDEVAILMGASVPFVGRERADGTWELLGECYVHGIMDGEMVSALGGAEPDVFQIT